MERSGKLWRLCGRNLRPLLRRIHEGFFFALALLCVPGIVTAVMIGRQTADKARQYIYTHIFYCVIYFTVTAT